PQRLLPPHAPDQATKAPVANMASAALARDRAKGINRDRNAGETEEPENSGRPSGLQQESNDVGNRVGVHSADLPPSAKLGSRAARSRQALAAAAITLSEAALPSASPFSKSPSTTAIWFVTWAKHKTGLRRAWANA